MTVNVAQLLGQGEEVVRRLRRMAAHGGQLYKTNRVFKSLCLASGPLLLFWVVFGGGGATTTAPPPPPAIVGPGGPVSGSVPYQFSTPQQGPDPASLQRQQVFYGVYDGLRTETRAGYRCDTLAAAVGSLTAQDRAQSIPAAGAAIAEADSCRASIELSNRRFAALTQAVTAYQAEETPATATTLSRAGKAIIGFDLSREIADRSQTAIDLAQAAATRLQDSKAKIQAFADASAGAAAGASLEAQTRLVAAAETLSSFDRAGLSPAQQDLYRTATDLADRFRASDRRLDAVLRHAGGSAPGGNDADPAALVSAVGALTALDIARLPPDKKEALDSVQAAAREAAFALLGRLQPRLDQNLSATDDEQVARVRQVIGTADPAQLTPEQGRGLELADKAVRRVRESTARIEEMRTAVAAWQKSPSPLAGNQVLAAYKAVSDYDRSRFSAGDQSTYGQLESAYYVVAGKSIGLSAATRGSLPLFVVVREAKGGPASALSDEVGEDLVRAGYHLADRQSGAAMLIELSGTVDSHGVTQTTVTAMPGALASATLRASWTADGSEFDRTTAKGNGIAGTDEQASAASFHTVAERLAARFRHFVETGERQ